MSKCRNLDSYFPKESYPDQEFRPARKMFALHKNMNSSGFIIGADSVAERYFQNLSKVIEEKRKEVETIRQEKELLKVRLKLHPGKYRDEGRFAVLENYGTMGSRQRGRRGSPQHATGRSNLTPAHLEKNPSVRTNLPALSPLRDATNVMSRLPQFHLLRRPLTLRGYNSIRAQGGNKVNRSFL